VNDLGSEVTRRKSVVDAIIDISGVHDDPDSSPSKEADALGYAEMVRKDRLEVAQTRQWKCPSSPHCECSTNL
jgi:hypothetical protein